MQVLTLLATLGCSPTRPPPPASARPADLAEWSPPTPACPGGTLSALQARMSVTPLSDGAAPDTATQAADRHYTFWFSTDPESPDYWSFGGRLVARGDCIVHAEVTRYDN